MVEDPKEAGAAIEGSKEAGAPCNPHRSPRTVGGGAPFGLHAGSASLGVGLHAGQPCPQVGLHRPQVGLY